MKRVSAVEIIKKGTKITTMITTARRVDGNKRKKNKHTENHLMKTFKLFWSLLQL